MAKIHENAIVFWETVNSPIIHVSPNRGWRIIAALIVTLGNNRRKNQGGGKVSGEGGLEWSWGKGGLNGKKKPGWSNKEKDEWDGETYENRVL